MVALVGMPNTGKSTLFNALTGGQARIGNWPGLTVELLRGRIPAEGAASSLTLVDLPGIHDLSGRSEDEAVVQRFLRETPPDLVLVVLNAGQVSHQLRLLLQIQALGLPLVAALNMSDEAERLGLLIDAEGLTTALGSAVLMVSARNRRGLVPLVQQLRHVAMSGSGVPSLGGPRANDQPLEVFQQTLLNRFVQVPEPLVHRRTRALDRVLLHPIGGLGVFLLLVLAVFQLLYAFTTPLQDLLGTGLDGVQAALLQPGLEALRCPAWLQGFLLEGLWLGVGTVVTFMPLISLFYVLIGLIEDSGYLPRAAFLMDGLMRVLGLDGRAFVLQVLGFGCNVPSIVGTRVIRDRGMRLLAMLTIPFSLCQARLVVFVFMAGVFFPRPWWAPGLVLFGFYMLSFVAAIITGLVFKRVYPSREGLVLELPPYRAPSPTTILRRGGERDAQFPVHNAQFHHPGGRRHLVADASASFRHASFRPELGRRNRSPVSAFAGPDRDESRAHCEPVLRIYCQGDPAGGDGGDLCHQRGSARGGVAAGHHSGAGLELHDVCSVVHPLPGHDRGADQGVGPAAIRRGVPGLVFDAGLADGLCGVSRGPGVDGLRLMLPG